MSEPTLGTTVARSIQAPDTLVSSASQLLRFLVEAQVYSTDPPADYMATSVYFACATGSISGSSAWATATQKVTDCFSGAYHHGTDSPFTLYSNFALTVKGYDLADAKPRPIRGEAVYTPASFPVVAGLAPAELAVPLRYFANRNVKKQRGRIYLGGFNSSDTKRAVLSVHMQQAINLGNALYGAAGDTTVFPGGGYWCLWSRHDNLFWPISDWWCNDQWAHMESREHIEASRLHQTASPPPPGAFSGPLVP